MGQHSDRIAYVLGGGGVHGAVQVGMLQALHERGIRPDLIVGTSIGAMNGALFAADPDAAVDRLHELWANVDTHNPFEASLFERAATFARTRTHLHDNHRLRRLLLASLPIRDFAQLQIPFECVAACIERATARWFDEGPLVEVLLASAAVPGLLPPVEIDGEHHLDGGLVDSIPVGRAIAKGATRVYVLQVGRIEHALEVPSTPWEVGMVAFEIARRHRFVEALEHAPADVDIHVLPSGADDELRPGDPAQLRYGDTSRVAQRIATSYDVASSYLDQLDAGTRPRTP